MSENHLLKACQRRMDLNAVLHMEGNQDHFTDFLALKAEGSASMVYIRQHILPQMTSVGGGTYSAYQIRTDLVWLQRTTTFHSQTGLLQPVSRLPTWPTLLMLFGSIDFLQAWKKWEISIGEYR